MVIIRMWKMRRIYQNKKGGTARTFGLTMLLIGIIMMIAVFVSWSTTNSLLTSLPAAVFFILGILSVLIGWIIIKGK